MAPTRPENSAVSVKSHPQSPKISPKPGSSTGTVRQLISKNFSDWCEVTPWHCIINVHKAPKLLIKLFWAFVVLFAAFLAFYQSGMLIWDYINQSQWVTSVAFEMPEDAGLDWPNISVCNLNDDFKSKFETFNLTDPYGIALMKTMTMEGILFYKRYQATHTDQSDNDTIDDTENRYRDRLAQGHNLSVSELLTLLTKKCEDTVIHCGYSGSFRLHENIECCDGQQKIRWRGCFSIHPTARFGKSRLKLGMEDSGIYYLLDPSVYDYYDKLILDSKPSAGFRLQLYFGTLEAAIPESILLAPGTHTLISLLPQKHITLKQLSDLPFYERKKSCSDETNYEYQHVLPSAYTQPLCQTDCAVNWQIHMCNCTLMTVRLRENRECRGQDIRTCSDLDKDQKNWNRTFEDGFNVFTCLSSCPEACQYRNVEAKASQAAFPASPKVSAFVTYLNRAFPNATIPYDENMARQLILFEVSYDAMVYEVITKMEKTTVGQLISNVGGALGVWTGLSLLSIYQALVYFGSFFWELVKKAIGNVIKVDTKLIWIRQNGVQAT